MSLFQPSVLKKYLSQQDTALVQKAYKKYAKYFHNAVIQENIRNSKEEQFQEGFLRELFVDILGYTLNPAPSFNLTTELKNIKGAKKDEFKWLDLFEENKTKAQTLKSQIETTEKAIDKMVYELYGMSEEEINIVENS
jgi:hypothetical protein